MPTFAQQVIREPEVEDARHYARRVHQLAWFYALLFVGALLGIGLLVWQAQLYVTLSQRSNVETLTLAFFLIFFGYLALLSARGAAGALRLLYYRVLEARKVDQDDIQRRKLRALGTPRHASTTVAVNIILEREGQPGRPFTLAVADRVGAMGELVVDRAAITHQEAFHAGSSSLLGYFVDQLNRVLRARGAPADVQIVEWGNIADEATSQYLHLVRFARNLEAHLGAGELWPKRILTADDCAELERRLSAVCGALRDEAFLPQWEYEGNHQIPLIPEPLGIISLSRTEKRVDPVSSMGCAVAVVLMAVLAFLVIFFFPPWVPGK